MYLLFIVNGVIICSNVIEFHFMVIELFSGINAHVSITFDFVVVDFVVVYSDVFLLAVNRLIKFTFSL